MLVIGTGGLASDMLLTLSTDNGSDGIVLYNDVDDVSNIYFKDYFKIITSKSEAKAYFNNVDNRFYVAIGDNILREKVTRDFIEIGGVNPTYVSKSSYVGSSARISPNGVFIMQFNNISMNVQIDEGCIVYLACGIGHDSHIRKYNLISSHVVMSDVKIGEYTSVGIGVKFKPGVRLGKNCTVGTGSVVTKSFSDDSIIFGVPAILKT